MNHLPIRRWLVGILLMTGGCTTTGQAPALADWTAAQTHRSTAAEPALSADATLPDYRRYALLHNPALQADFARWRAALQGIAPARALPDPRFTFGYFVRHVETRVGPQEYRLGIAQLFPWFGQLDLRGQMETAAARAAQQRYEATKLDLVYQLEMAYYQLYYLERATAIQTGNRQLLAYLEKVAQTNYRAGRSTQADVLKIQMELGKLEDNLKSLEDSRHPSRTHFNAILNRPAAAPISIPERLPPQPALPDQAELEARLDNHPLLRALDHQLEKTRLAIEHTRKAGYPNWTLSLDYIATGGRQVAAPPTDDGKDPLVAMLALNLPLERDKYRAETRRAQIQQQATQFDRRQLVNQLATRLHTALYQWRDSQRKIDLYGTALVPRAEQALQVTQQAFITGTGLFVDLIDAQRLRLEFQLGHQRALADRARHRAQIDQLTGGRPEVLPSTEKE
ncbi:MAG: TolC family protein [Candidatus Latescibacteria bacterium]|nr:TolC family protein [Candidatus Latescibacterota bacterium]